MTLRQTGIKLFLGILGSIIALVFIEGAVRLMVPAEQKRPRSDRPRFFYDIDRDHSFFPEKRSESYRISVIGDSFTTPFKVQFDDTYSARLERILNLSPGRRPVEVINCGVAGSSTVSEVPVVKRAIETGTDLVILQITLNDPQPRPFFAESEEFKRRFGKHRPSAFWRDVFGYWKSAGFISERIHNSRSRKAYLEYFSSMYSDPKLWKNFLRAIKQMKREADERNVKFAAVVFPLFEFLQKDYPFRDLHAKINSALDSLGIEHLDLLPLYLGMEENRLQVQPGKDSHPNEIAHRLAAENIYLWLVKREILPNELKIARKSKKMVERKVSFR